MPIRIVEKVMSGGTVTREKGREHDETFPVFLVWHMIRRVFFENGQSMAMVCQRPTHP